MGDDEKYLSSLTDEEMETELRDGGKKLGVFGMKMGQQIWQV